MKQECKITLLVFFILCVFFNIAFSDGGIYWQENGVLLCDSTFSGGSYPLAIVSDSCGGAIVVWEDDRSGYISLYVQRIDSSGNIKWDTNGVFVGTSYKEYIDMMPKAVSDGESGMIVTWTDEEDIFVQRLDSAGTRLWGANGVKIRDAPGGDTTARSPRIVSDGQGGAIVSMVEGPYEAVKIFAQRVDSNGNLCWQSGGIPICSLGSNASPAPMMDDGANGVIAFWDNLRNGSNDVYAQRIKMDGTICWQPNGIKVCSLSTEKDIGLSSIKGGGSNIVIPWSDDRSGNWDIYAQRLDTNGIYQWPDSGIAVCAEDGWQGWWKVFGVRSDKNIILEWLDDRNDGYHDLYAQKLNLDGTTAWTENGLFVARVADTSQETHRIGIPIESDGREGAIFVWEDYRSGNADIYCQRVDSSGVLQWFVTGLPVCTTPGNHIWGPVSTIDGKGGAITAWGDLRNHGSVWAQRIGDGGTGIKEQRDIRHKTTDIRLYTHPNPFTTSTTITLTFPSEGHRAEGVELNIYDIAGRLVRTIVPEFQSSRVQRVEWDGKDEKGKEVIGVFFIELSSKAYKFKETKKIIKLK